MQDAEFAAQRPEPAILPALTTEEIAVIDALTNAHASAVLELAKLTSHLQDTMHASDHVGFAEVKAELRRLGARCQALKLAIDLARETFNKRVLDRAHKANRRPFEDGHSFFFPAEK